MTAGTGNYLKALIERCIAGEDHAWEELVKMISPSVSSVCNSMRLTREESLEVFGQVCYLLLTNLIKLRSPEKIVAFASTAARREVLRLSRRSKVLKRILSRESMHPDKSRERNPEEQLEAKQRREILISAVLSLPEKESKLMWSLFLDESKPKYEEVSTRLGIPVSSIGPTRARCLAKLRRILRRKGFRF